MKRLLALLALFGISGLALAQATNPQPDYVSAMQQAQPSMWLNFNDTTTNFVDQVSGSVFAPTITTGYLPTGTSGTVGQLHVLDQPVAPGPLTTVCVQYPVAPTAATQLLITLGTLDTSYDQYTIVDSFYLTMAASTAAQCFTAGSGFSARNVAAGDFIGFWQASGNGPGQVSGTAHSSFYATSASAPSGTIGIIASSGWALSLTATTTSAGTVTPRQPGFDLRWPNNTSAEFPYNGWVAAPNDSLGDLEWNTPWSIRVVVDKIDFDKLTNTPLVLASKGDIDSTTGASWKLELIDGLSQEGFNLATQACWILKAPTPGVGSSNTVYMELCSNGAYDLINKNAGPYDFVLTNDGGGWTSDFQMYVNGMSGGGPVATQFTALDNWGFDPAVLHVTGGTGYANSTPYTSSNGCVTGDMVASGGVPDGFTYSYNANCTTVPTITLTAPTGTGAVITADIYTSSMSTASTNPLMIGSPYGFSTDTNQAATYVDEFAEFNTALTPQQIQNMWTTIPWYQTIVGLPPAVPPLVLFDDDGDSDPDNEFAAAEYVALAQKGYLTPVGAVMEDTAGSCQAMWRQMLDQGGLGSVPVATAFTFSSGSNGCYSANIATYNPSTPTASGAPYETAVQLYRSVLAAHPSTPVDIVIGGPFTGLAAFMQSSADGISPLTGLQLLAQDAANGAGIYNQASVECTPSSPPDPVPCSGSNTGADGGWDWASQAYVFENNGSMPIDLLAGTPQSTGPGIYQSRTAKDPMYLYLVSVGNDSRQGWDSMVLAQVVTGKLRNGLQIGYSGGTGYADYTPLSFTGGGTGAELEGWLTASSGVPNGVVYPGGGTAYEQYQGIGDGFTSLPTLSATGTGSGVTLTPYLNSVCGTLTVTNSGTTWTQSFDSTTCSQHYAVPFSVKAALTGNTTVTEPVLLQWFVNSLISAPPPGRPRP